MTEVPQDNKKRINMADSAQVSPSQYTKQPHHDMISDTGSGSSSSSSSSTSSDSDENPVPDIKDLLNDVFQEYFMTTEEHSLVKSKQRASNSQPCTKKKNIADLLQEIVYLLKRHH